MAAWLEETGSAALFRTLAGVLFAAGRGTALQTDFLAMTCRSGVALRRYRLGGADVGFDSDFFGHEGLRLKNGLAHDFKLPRAAAVVRSESRAGAVAHPH